GPDHASESRPKRRLAAARRAHQQRQLAAGDREAHPPERLDPRRSAAEHLHDIAGFNDRLGHRVNTIAGSMRITCTIAAIADSTHITMVSVNSTAVRPGVRMIGNAVSAVRWTMIHPMPAAILNPMTALS